MSSDEGASTRIRKREGATRYAHERIARRNPGRTIRLAAALLTVAAAMVLGVVVAEKSAVLAPLESLRGGSTTPFPGLISFVLDPTPIRVIDPTPFLVVAGVVRNVSLIVAGLATGVGGCLLCVAAIRVRGWR